MRLVRSVLLLFVLAGAGFTVLAWHPALDPATPPSADRALVAKGAALAALGDCAVCHTASAGAAYAGGRKIATPFGAIYSANITPDAETGIGRWSEAAFVRAMRRGIDRTGNNLYPAFPFDHYTRVSDEDLAALYAFLMAGAPVRATRPANELPFPLTWRPLLAGWNLLFLDERRYRPDPAHDAQWNRGAYLVEGLAHCGACHTPRNFLGAEQPSEAFGGGTAEGWTAPPLKGRAWTADSFYAYLRAGLDAQHGAAAGPMGPVTWDLARAPDEDVHAIAVYLASQAGPVGPAPAEAPTAMAGSPGAAIFAGACASCHGSASPMTANGAPSLRLGSVLRGDDPGNALRVILGGIRPEPFRAGPLMPAFGAILKDDQLAELAAYLRARFAPDRPPWTGLPDAIRHIRTEGSAT
jgi:mono/diheme cytochrome c family protein